MSKIRVQSRRASFRRCGMEFTRAGRDLDASKLDAKVLARLRADPNLVVSDLPDKGKGSTNSTPPKDDGAAGHQGKSAPVDTAPAAPQAPAKKAPAKRAPRKAAAKKAAK